MNCILIKSLLISLVLLSFSSGEIHAKIKKPKISTKAFKNAGNKIKSGASKVGGSVAGLGKLVDKGLKKAGLPGSSDIKKTLKCIKPTLSDLNKLRKNPKNKQLLEKLRNGPCMQELQVLDNACLGPAISGASMLPQVGPFISGVCTQIGNINAKANAAIDKAEQMQAIAANPSGAINGAIQNAEGDEDDDDDS